MGEGANCEVFGDEVWDVVLRLALMIPFCVRKRMWIFLVSFSGKFLFVEVVF